LRAEEAVIESDSAFNASQHLSFANIAQPSFIKVRIKQSKTDPFRVGVDVIIGHTGGKLCPVPAVLNYLAKKGPGPGLLFRFEDGQPLTRQRLISSMREILQKVGIDRSKYSGHSFWIGATTIAAALGIQDSSLLIKIMGCWESVAY